MPDSKRHNFQDVFFNGHPVNGQNPHPIPPPKKEPPPPPPAPDKKKKKKRRFFLRKPNPKTKPKPQKKQPPKKHLGWKIAFWILIILLLTAAGFIFFLLSRVNYSRDDLNHEAVIQEVGELKSDPNVENILIFGADNHASDEYGRSDTMLLVSLDKNHHILKLTSFLRDLYLDIPGYGEDRLNAAFSYGGPKLAIQTIEYHFRIKIDSYIVLDYESFTSIIDTMGGIEIELTEAEIDYIDWQSWKNKQVESRYELDAGSFPYSEKGLATVHLNGRQALWHARNRNSERSDFDRTDRQRAVFNIVLTKLKESDPFTLTGTAYKIAPMITTNMNLGNMLGIFFGTLQYLRYDRTEFRVPQSFNYADVWVGDKEVLKIQNIEEERKALQRFIFESELPDKS